MHFHGNPIPPDEDPMYVWRIKSQGNEEARQQFLDGYVPQIRELGLEIPDPALRKDEETGEWLYTEPDWEKLRAVVTGHGPASEERLAFRRLSRADVAWVEQVVLAEAA
jgi:ring-1,2-phenylacetyl-CoA epoxidase subunit PaaA